jgi:multimeric flavodoxin WrbA
MRDDLLMTKPVRIVGLGGSLRAESTSRTALAATLEGAAAGGAETELIWVRAARQFQNEGTCDYAEHRPYAAGRP